MGPGCRLSHTKDICPPAGPLVAPPRALHEVQAPGGRGGFSVLKGEEVLSRELNLPSYNSITMSYLAGRVLEEPSLYGGSSDSGPLASLLLGAFSLKVSGWGLDLLTHTASGG